MSGSVAEAPIECSIVRAADRELTRQVAELHRLSLGRPSMGRLGERSLLGLYEGVLASEAGFLVAARQGSELRGYILATADSADVPPVMMRWPHRAAWTIVLAISGRRGAIARLIEGLSNGRIVDAVRAELMVIAVEPDFRSRGIGRRLLDALHQEFLARRVATYKVIVHRDRTDADRFYRQNGFRLDRTFSLWGLEWNLYLRALGGVSGRPIA